MYSSNINIKISRRPRSPASRCARAPQLDRQATGYGQSKILDFRGFDSRRVLILRGGIFMPIGNFPESLSQAILVGIILGGGPGDWAYGVGQD